jgi:DNA-binding response OmpR family regulator
MTNLWQDTRRATPMVEPRILIVESDDALRQKLYRGMLDLDLFSDCTSDVREAMAFLSQRRYSIVVLDVAVAGGYDKVTAAVQLMPEIERPIVIATAETDRLGRIDGEGVQVIIRRPLHVRDIAELARACVDASGRRRAKAVAQPDELRA